MFDAQHTKDGLTIRMDTDLSHVDACIEPIKLLLGQIGRSDLLFSISLLTREALNNAMVHGNNLTKSKEVFFTLHLKGGKLLMTVEDQGPGFDWQRQVHKQSDISEENGRGHEIYQNYASSLTYNASGNMITLTIDLP